MTIPEFNTTEDRDRRYSGYIAAGYSMVNGMQCLVAGRLCVWHNGSWLCSAV